MRHIGNSLLGALGLLAGLALVDPSVARAQAAAQPPATERLDVPAGGGRLLRFDRPYQSLFVSNPSVADVQAVSPTLAYVTGTAPGETELFAVDAAETVVGGWRVVVREDAAAARQRVAPIAGSGALQLDFAGETPVVRGRVRDVDGALDASALGAALSQDGAGFVDRTTYEGATQVNLRVRFVEVSRTELFRLGVNWAATLEAGAFTFGLATGPLSSTAGAVADGFLGGLFGTAGAGVSTGTFDADVLINALADEGVVHILAEPTLTTVNGRPARFQAGGEFPFLVAQGDDRVTTEFRSFGVALEFTPTLLPGGRIALEVAPEVSFISDELGVTAGGFSIPGRSVRTAFTTVELASGQSFVIAGLFQSRLEEGTIGLPGLSDLPGVGALFGTRDFSVDETELVILITPYLVGDNAAPVAAPVAAAERRMDVGFIVR